MKKVIALLTTLFLTTAVFAQENAEESTPAVDESATLEESAAQEPPKEEKKPFLHVDKRPDPKFGIRLGVHFAGVKGDDLSFGWHLGGVFYPVKFFDAGWRGDFVGVKMFLEPHLYFEQKASMWGGKQYWVEIPVHASFMFTVAGMRFKYALGPYVTVGAFGDFEYETDVLGTPFTQKTKRFDLGLNQVLGYEAYKNIWTDFSVGMGFLDMVKNDPAGDSNTTFIFKITAGIDF